MKYEPRDYQLTAIEHAVEFLRDAAPGARRLYAGPTGSGKSVVILEVQRRLPGAWIITPVVEVVAGLLEKLGIDTSDMSEARLISAAWQRQITTPIRFRNALLIGEGVEPRYLILDEAHHHNADTYQQLDVLTGQPATVGYTASPYRGTPKGTAAFLKAWGEPTWILTYPQAVARGVISMPACRVVPILDDDTVEVKNGEFVVEVVERATPIEEVVRLAATCRDGRATMFAAPSTLIAQVLTRELDAAGLPAVCVTGETPHAERVAAFRDTVAGRTFLVQVRVVGEGVDLPIRRLIDLAPAVSPVKWLQLFGRITRPVPAGEVPPEYVCCNRNLLRHAYLLDGCLPTASLVEAQKQFGTGTRNSWRVLGLESLGKFKEVKVPLKNGLQGFLYCLASVEDLRVTSYAAIVHPALEEPLWAKRVDGRKADGTRAYGRWSRCERPDDLSGYATVPAPACTEKQINWWKKSAAAYGLDADAEPDRRTFQALPILNDLGVKIV